MTSTSLTRLYKSHETHLQTTHHQPRLNDTGTYYGVDFAVMLTHAREARMSAAMGGISSAVCARNDALLRKRTITNKDSRRVHLYEGILTFVAREIQFSLSHSPRCYQTFGNCLELAEFYSTFENCVTHGCCCVRKCSMRVPLKRI